MATEKGRPPMRAREPWRGEAQEGNGLGTGITPGREDRALCREKGLEDGPDFVR
jgi:hypothetical protein